MARIVDALRSLFGNRVTVEETTTGHGRYAQEHLPGERTIVISYSGGEMFFEVDEEREVVYVPKAYEDSGFPIGPSDSTPLVDRLAQQTPYDVEFAQVFNR